MRQQPVDEKRRLARAHKDDAAYNGRPLRTRILERRLGPQADDISDLSNGKIN